jgi:hypothetical protein
VQAGRSFLPFRIDREITKEERYQERMRTIKTVHTQQAMSDVRLDRSTSIQDRTS